MKTGIVGAGNIGGALTRRLASLGYDVSVANSRGPETLSELAAETGATATTAQDAVRDAELVIITIPLKNVPDLPPGLLDTRVDGAPVIDTNNYYPQQRDGRIDAIESGTTESRWVSDQLGAPVIKAFNNIYADHLLTHGRPPGEERIALPVAGDDEALKRTVMDVVDALGFDPVDAGSLDEFWRQQPETPCYGTDLPAARLKSALAEASPERPAAHTAR